MCSFGGSRGGVPRFPRFDIQISQKVTASGVHAPPTRSTLPYEKFWTRHCVGLQFVIYASLLNFLFHPQTVGILLYLVGLYFRRNSVLYDDKDKTKDKNKVLDTEDNTEIDEDENKVTLLMQEDGSGTKVISVSLHLYLVSPLVPQEILVTAPELQEEFLFSGNKTIYASD